jgi:RNA polymerase sigma-70 factor (ECF subfamily)
MASPRPQRDPLVALRAGDPAPFEEFVRAWTRSLVAYFRQQGAGLGHAEDLTQEVFLKLFESAGRYQPRERLTAFCFRTARNLWIDQCRRASVRAGYALASDSPGAPAEAIRVDHDPGAALLLEEEERRLCALLGVLPPGQRRVLELALLAELGYAEIAALLALPVGTVKSRMFHAVRRLRAAWQAQRLREGVA